MEIGLVIIDCVHVLEHELYFVDKLAEYQNIGYRKNLTYAFARLSTGFPTLTRGVCRASRKWALNTRKSGLFTTTEMSIMKLLSAM